MLESALYIVPTPIGNLEDITLRAVRVLKEASLIAAEDTRHSKILLDHLGITGAKLVSCYDQVEADKASLIIEEVRNGGSVALISDAGSPLINDPGYKVVSLCAAAGVKVVPLPGPCAVITALEAAAQPTDCFKFMGFFPVKDKELRDCLTGVAQENCTVIFYETPRRILSTVKVLAEILPDRNLSICRELTKTFESIYRMRAGEMAEFLEASPERTKGEFVVVIGPAAKKTENEISPKLEKALFSLLENNSVKTVTSVLSELSGVRKKDLYDLALEKKA